MLAYVHKFLHNIAPVTLYLFFTGIFIFDTTKNKMGDTSMTQTTFNCYVYSSSY
jgi:hypothetical protein